MERNLDLGLERDIGVRQQRQQRLHVGRHLVQQIGINHVRAGWRGGRAGPRHETLPPQAFPTEPGGSSALRLSVQVGGLQT